MNSLRTLPLSQAFKKATLTIILGSLATSGFASESDTKINQSVSIDDIFSNSMVLQRSAPIKFRGTAKSGEPFSLEFASENKTVQPNADGRWSASFTALPEGGPFNLVVEGKEVISDILIGDVFLCSGQSNMEYPIYRALNPDRELSAEHRQNIRLITIPKATALTPEYNFEPDSNWVVANSETLRNFSAVCYFTARDLELAAEVPIGLIDASWGGTKIESWMSVESLKTTGQRTNDIDLFEIYTDDKRAGMEVFGEMWDDWWRNRNPDKAEPWLEPSRYDWTDVPDFTNWKNWGLAGLENYNGQVWYQTDFILTKAHTEASYIELGSIDELDHVWINGQRVGTQFSWGGDRRYPIPTGLLKSGVNSIVVNVASAWDMGGMMGPKSALKLTNDADIDIALSDWSYRKAEQPGMDAPFAPWESVSGITGIGNAMLGPLRGLKIKGGYWYQGESNAGDEYSYEPLLNGLLQDWKTYFGDDAKMVIIQLPEFGSVSDTPVDSGWAKIREAQRQVALKSEDAALVVAMGTGDAYDIHPPNKQEVAHRAADAAENLFYGKDNANTNRDPLEAKQSSIDVTVALSGSNRALKTLSSNHVIGLELCSPTLCQYVMGQVEDSNLIISRPQSLSATKVRYNWSDVPYGNLFDESGLPVGPFEIAID
ncbi:9-O-acetylesterase [Litorimonas cladophorae]|uniref:9-O-acetylesterase n=1 Tax=Litorimonas cladophorae TaxID=1220491 RepID=A0A918KQB1_9PROT|nr:sialate O-acetylesterase [Litorimonas cladophorae]GGX70726.1 9-O-acetylesterase [Litorimonas cladophorae]